MKIPEILMMIDRLFINEQEITPRCNCTCQYDLTYKIGPLSAQKYTLYRTTFSSSSLRFLKKSSATSGNEIYKKKSSVELEDFVGCVAENRESGWVRNEDVRKVLCTIEALRLSLESGEKVPVNYERRKG